MTAVTHKIVAKWETNLTHWLAGQPNNPWKELF